MIYLAHIIDVRKPIYMQIFFSSSLRIVISEATPNGLPLQSNSHYNCVIIRSTVIQFFSILNVCSSGVEFSAI